MTNQVISAIHAAGGRWVLSLTGGGVTAAGELLSVPGGSRSIMEINVPYDEQALLEFLGRRPEIYCSAPTSRQMALRSLERARHLAAGETVFGLGCTAGLVSDRPKRGDHRIHVSSAGKEQLDTWSLVLSKGSRERAAEERVAAHMVLHAMAVTLGLTTSPAMPLLPGEQLEHTTDTNDSWPNRLQTAGAILVEADGQFVAELSAVDRQSLLLVPGAFNPVHAAHFGLAETAQRLEGKRAFFELSMTNVDKPEISSEEVRRRLAQFTGRAPVWLTRAPRFVDKARMFPGATFVIGADTALRLVSPRYYENQQAGVQEALKLFRAQECRFLVARRLDETGCCLGIDDVPIPSEYRELFRSLPGEESWLGLSSTIFRKGK